MNVISNLYNAMPTAAAVTAGAAWYGSKFAGGLAYLYAPAIIRNAVVSAAQKQFGMYVGTIVGNATAPAIVAAVMPAVVAYAQAAGAFCAAAAVTRAFQQANKANNDRAYQEDCKNIAADCEVNGRVEESDAEDDLVAVNLRRAGDGDDFEVGVLDELA